MMYTTVEVVRSSIMTMPTCMGLTEGFARKAFQELLTVMNTVLPGPSGGCEAFDVSRAAKGRGGLGRSILKRISTLECCLDLS
jgi:hypothetical protein